MCCHQVFHRYPPFNPCHPMPMFFSKPCMPPVLPMYNNCCYQNMGNSFAAGAGFGIGVGVVNILGGLINRLC